MQYSCSNVDKKVLISEEFYDLQINQQHRKVIASNIFLFSRRKASNTILVVIGCVVD